ncbi:MAG: hypothetical protein V7707_07875 [Motiliproteus sp.]
MSRILIVLSVLMLAACTESVDLQLEPEVTLFSSSDRDKTVHLSASDKEHAALNKWLRENSSGWYPTTGRYLGGVYLESGNNGVQVTDTKVIIYSTAKTQPQATFVQTLDKGELDGIKRLGD